MFTDMTDGEVLIMLKKHQAVADAAARELQRRADEEPQNTDA